MTVIQAIRNLLDSDEWTPSISGRPHDVPKPVFVDEKDDIQKSLRTRDVAYVRDAGDEIHEILGFGASHYTVDWTVAVELRSSDRRVDGTSTDGRIRMYGERGAGSLGENEVGRWPGLGGETQRILYKHRNNFKEFNILAHGIRGQDQSDMMGANTYRLDVIIPLKSVANPIDTST